MTVRTLDLCPGGELLYAMTAIDPAQIGFMKKAGMPLTQELRITFTEIVPLRRLAYVHLADFIPGVEPYDVATVVELQPMGQDVRMILTVDAMHSDEWTDRAVMGWNSELGKLDAPMAARKVGGTRERPGRSHLDSGEASAPWQLDSWRRPCCRCRASGQVDYSPVRVARPSWRGEHDRGPKHSTTLRRAQERSRERGSHCRPTWSGHGPPRGPRRYMIRAGTSVMP